MQNIRYLYSKILGSHEPNVVLVLTDSELDSIKQLGVKYTQKENRINDHHIVIEKEDFLKKLAAA